MHNWLEKGQERDGQSCQEGTEAQRPRHEAHCDEDRTERLLLQLLFSATGWVVRPLKMTWACFTAKSMVLLFEQQWISKYYRGSVVRFHGTTTLVEMEVTGPQREWGKKMYCHSGVGSRSEAKTRQLCRIDYGYSSDKHVVRTNISFAGFTVSKWRTRLNPHSVDWLPFVPGLISEACGIRHCSAVAQ